MRHTPEVLKLKSFRLFLTGQCLSNIGEACRFVSITLFLVEATGSGVSAVLGLICAAVPGLVFSPVAGVIGDLLPEKLVLAVDDFIRAFLVFLFISCTSVSGIYLLLVVLSIADTLSAPARKKFIVVIAGKKNIIPANTLLTGASGIAFLIGPLIGGVLVDSLGSSPPFIINICTYIISGITILLIKNPRESEKSRSFHMMRNTIHMKRDTVNMKRDTLHTKLNTIQMKRNHSGYVSFEKLYEETLNGFVYFKNNEGVKQVVLIGAVMGFGMVSMNMAFYPFAFDILRVTAEGWSLMLSIFYGTNLIAMAAAPMLSAVIKNNAHRLIFGCLLATSAIWMIYSMTRSLALVLLLQFLEGTILAVCGIILASLLQSLSDKSFIARVSGANDLAGSLCRLLAMLFTFVALKYSDFKVVFIFNAILLFVFSIINLSSRHRPAVQRQLR